MAISRLAVSNPGATTDTLIYTRSGSRDALASIIATNKSSDAATIRVWVVPSGQDATPANHATIAYMLENVFPFFTTGEYANNEFNDYQAKGELDSLYQKRKEIQNVLALGDTGSARFAQEELAAVEQEIKIAEAAKYEVTFAGGRIEANEFFSNMAAIDDLNTAVSNLSTAVQALIDKVGSAPAGTPDAAVEAAVNTINDLTTKANTAATA